MRTVVCHYPQKAEYPPIVDERTAPFRVVVPGQYEDIYYGLIEATTASNDIRVNGYERATPKLATLTTSDVGEKATEVWADKAEHKRRPLNRPFLITNQVVRFHCVEGTLNAELKHNMAATP